MDLSTRQLPAGFGIRSPRHEDAVAVADLLRACDVAIHGEPDTDVKDVRDDWAAPGFDLARDAWVIEAEDGACTAYAWFRVRQAGDFDASLHVHPGESVNALAPALLEGVEIRAREQSPGQGGSVCIFVAAVESAMRAVLEQAGYREVRTFFRMRIDLAPAAPAAPAPAAPTPPSAGSIEIRPLRLGTDDRALYETLEEAFAEHFRPDPRPFDEWWALRALHPRFLPELWLLAWDGERVAGALTAYDYVDIGFISMLGVRKPCRGRGLGSSLLTRSFETFRARGQLRIALGVDAENESAVGLYERVGMRVEQRHHLMQKRLGA